MKTVNSSVISSDYTHSFHWGSFLVLLVLLIPLLISSEVEAATDCVSQTDVPQAECETLIDLYTSTGGASWSDSPTNNWNVTNTPCSWTGVTCSGGHVSQIDRNSMNLEGTLPDLSALASLQDLFLYDNQLTGNIPSLDALVNLKQLNLDHNQLTGSIPDLSALTNLQFFNATGSELVGNIPELNALTNLWFLGLSGNKLDGPIPNLNNLIKLQFLYLDNNQLTGSIPDLSALTSLNWLSLHNNQLTGTVPSLPNSLGTNPDYPGCCLSLNNNQLSGTIPDLSGTGLTVGNVDLSCNQFTGENGISATDLDPDWDTTQCFPPNSTFTLTVVLNDTTTTPELAGSVMSEPAGIDCGEDCEEEFAQNSNVTLTAIPDSVFAVFTGWTGGCTGTDNPLTVTVDADKTCTPTFEASTATPDTSLTLTIKGTGTGVVSDKPMGGDCDPAADNCMSYPNGMLVQLTAEAGTGSHFSQWGGDCGESTDNMLDLVMDAAKTCEAYFELDATTETIALTVEKTEGGMVKDETGPLDCGETCTANYAKDGDGVQLHAVADAGFQFKEWTTCVETSSTENPLTVSTDVDKTCAATFEASGANVFTLTITAPTNGKITTQDGNIDCGATCSKDYDVGTEVSLSAIADDGFSLVSWTGDCAGTEATLVLPVDANKTCSATFQEVTPTPSEMSLTVQKEGMGTVTSDVGDINCGDVCQATFDTSATVTLTAQPAAGASFTSWSGDCGTGTETTATVTVDAVKTCTAMFGVLPTPDDGTTPPVVPEEPPVVPEEPPVVPAEPVAPAPPQTPEPCLLENIVQGTCNARGITVTGASVISHGNVSNLIISGSTANLGWISNATIQRGAIVTGGVLTGFIANKGTLVDIEFRGASIIGGTLSGTIMNIRNGLIEDVTFAAGAYLKGGRLKGRIVGDADNPATVDNVTIDAGSHLSGVLLGKNVVVMEGAVIDAVKGGTQQGVVWPKLPSLGIGLAQDKKGKALENIQAEFSGGISINDGKKFLKTVEVKPLSDSVDMRGVIKVDTTHMGQPADTFVFIAYRTTPESTPVYLMVDEDRNLLPWDEEMASLVAFQKAVELTTEQRLEIYKGILLYNGLVDISYGYRLNDGTVVYGAEGIQLIVNKPEGSDSSAEGNTDSEGDNTDTEGSDNTDGEGDNTDTEGSDSSNGESDNTDTEGSDNTDSEGDNTDAEGSDSTDEEGDNTDTEGDDSSSDAEGNADSEGETVVQP